VIVDLFSGAGGFSLGAHQAGFKDVLAVDKDRILTSAYGLNFPGAKLLHADISRLKAEKVRKKANGPIIGVIGGPPCQAFSEIGRKNPDDLRRHLVRHFFRLVSELKPKFFVMENVPGLVFDRHVGILEDALANLPKRYRVLDPLLLNSLDFGAPTVRKRVFVVGFDPDRMEALTPSNFSVTQEHPTTVRNAIGDLRTVKFVKEDERGYDLWRYAQPGRVSAYALGLRGTTQQFTGHRATIHTRAVKRRFAKVEPGTMDAVGKHPRLSWDGQCPTLRAGTGSDRGSFQSVRPIHPSEPRVITAREAARLQGFPDGFVFHPTTWHSFRMIGNSVSPIVACSILKTIRRKALI
jgi:DNA (cytosine-5)-methyltransferase 1